MTLSTELTPAAGCATMKSRGWLDEELVSRRLGVQNRSPAVGTDNKPTNCRMGYEPGDSFTCQYGCPEDFCSKSIMKVFPIFEAVRSEGDLRNLGGSGKHKIDIVCPDGVVKFRISAKRV